jgi:D-xylose transport system substrate-binding protein
VNLPKSKLTVAAVAATAMGVAVSGGATATASVAHRSTAHTASISLTQLTNNFSAMKQLKAIAAKGSGSIAAILPDTTSSLRWADFDAPDLKKAMLAAGIPASDIIIQNAQGSDSTFYTDAQEDITKGAKVLLTTPEDSGTGAKVEAYAKKHGVKVVDYDRLTLGGSRPYYVSFNNVQVGKLIGQGFVSCVAAWHVSKPQVIVMHGSVTDNNATLFYQGYNSVLAPKFKSGAYTNLTPPYTAGTWDNNQALTEFQTAYTAHPTANSMVNPNDETAAPIINYLIQKGIKPDTFPATGQDATLPALQAILAGYQCGTVYKPVYLEAQAAVALATYLRAGMTPPKSLVNGTTADINEHNKPVPSALLTPEWVTKANMKSTVIKDNFVPTKQICSGTFDGKVAMAGACKAAGI